MTNRSTAIFITILLVLLLIFPGIALICFGLLNVVDSVLGFGIFASDLNTYFWYIFGGICGGFFLIIAAAISIFFVLRQKKTTQTADRNEPLPPTDPNFPSTPSTPVEIIHPSEPTPPIPPGGQDEPPSNTDIGEPLPPSEKSDPDNPLPPIT
jgi:hypothetical protein